MAQFDLYPSPLVHAPYLIDIHQSNLLEPLTTRVVIPLRPVHANQERLPLSRLAPVIEIRGQPFILSTANIATVMAVELKSPLLSLAPTHRQVILDALDFLLHGF